MAALDGAADLTSPLVSGESRVLGLFGYPVEHSLSPAMHNAAIAALSLHFIYIPFSVRPDDLGPAIRSLIVLGIIGVNLTIPHKERALPFLDEIDSEARVIGAVNTVRNQEGRLLGYNTDGEGFFRPLSEAGFTARGKRVVVLGAGGAARSVVYRLLIEGATVTLANRTRERADRLAQEIGAAADSVVDTIDPWDAAAMKSALGRAELLVNTTSVGMSPHADVAPPLSSALLHPSLLVYDLIYSPIETRLLSEARSVGCQTLSGAAMLAHQGAAAFKIWTGIDPPVDVMQRTVVRGLKQSSIKPDDVR
jgi:shikimate dehydrogenase